MQNAVTVRRWHNACVVWGGLCFWGKCARGKWQSKSLPGGQRGGRVWVGREGEKREEREEYRVEARGGIAGVRISARARSALPRVDKRGKPGRARQGGAAWRSAMLSGGPSEQAGRGALPRRQRDEGGAQRGTCVSSS